MPLELTNVTKRYGDVTAAEDINLRAEDDDFLVLLGPSGSGKTTTLRMIAGLESVTEGRITIDGEVVNDLEPADRGISMVFQNYALYPHLTVEGNLSLGLKVSGVPNEEVTERVDRALEILDIPELRDRKPSELSGGQQQRVALGRAIVRQPDVFLMDEPLSNLDAKLRMEMRKELKELKHDLGTTFVYVTHDQVEAMTLATKIAVLNGGRIQQVGTPEELYDWPANEFVAEFIGSPSMNMFECRVVDRDGDLTLDFGHFEQSVDGEAASLLRDHGLESVTVGIRPEDIRLGEGLSNRAEVNLVEPVEADVYVYLTVDGREIVVQADRPREVAETDQLYARGSTVTFEFPTEDLHFFSEGRAIRARSVPESGRTEVS
jgi:multiple sugar transport system ATP-binding protein